MESNWLCIHTRPEQNDRHFADEIFKSFSLQELFSRFIVILLKFGSIDINIQSCTVVSDINSSHPEQMGHHLANSIFRCIDALKMFVFFNQISLKFVHKVLIDNNQALV